MKSVLMAQWNYYRIMESNAHPCIIGCVKHRLEIIPDTSFSSLHNYYISIF